MRLLKRLKLEVKAIWRFITGITSPPKELLSTLKSFKKIKGKDEKHKDNQR